MQEVKNQLLVFMEVERVARSYVCFTTTFHTLPRLELLTATPPPARFWQ